MLRLWAIVVIVFITPIVIQVSIVFAKEYGPYLAILLMFVFWTYLSAVTYFVFRAIGRMFGDR
jgi:hypothetical protein